MPPRHPLHADGEHRGDHRRQSLGHGGDGQRHAENEHVEDLGQAANVLDDDDRRDHHHGDGDDDQSENPADPVEFPLERRRLLRCGLQQSGDASHFGLHPGRGHDRGRVTVGGRRAAEDHVVPVTQRHVLGDDVGILGHRQALAGERGLGGLQGRRFQQPSIGRDGVAFVDQDDVAGDDLGGGEAAPLTVANDRRVGGRHRSQRRHCGLGSGFLDVAQGGVEQDHRQDGDGFIRKRRVALVRPTVRPRCRWRRGAG